jgi:hypothetical protein
MTTEAVRQRRKTVTRRIGWTGKLRPGDILQAVEKAQGLKKGEHVKPICLIRVVSVKREQLDNVYAYEGETAAEGFPDLTPHGFMAMFCKANRCETWRMVNRIEFEYED